MTKPKVPHPPAPIPAALADIGPAETMTVLQAAERLGISDKTIRKAIQRGELIAHLPPGANRTRPGRFKYAIRPEDIRAWWMRGYEP